MKGIYIMQLCTTDKPARFAVLDIPVTRIMGFAETLELARSKANALPNCFAYELTDTELNALLVELERA